MNLLLIASTFIAYLGSQSVVSPERATRPTFRGEGDGRLILLEIPEKVSLEFFVVQCARAGDDGAVFEVYRSGEPARPGEVRVGEVFLEEKSRVSFRIEVGATPFAPGDTFSFVTFEDVSRIDDLLDRWLDEYVRWIISREEKALFESLSGPAEKLAFIESFWRRRDPTPESPPNEARDEHARRFAYALQNFGAGTPGWATDRGKIYILLGAPNAIERNPAGRTAFERPSEIWTYNNARNPRLPASMDIAFVDFTTTGRFEIVSSSNLDVVAPLRTNLGYAMSELEAIGLMRSGGTLMDQTTGLRTEINPTRLATDRFDFERDLQEIAKVPRLTSGGIRAVTEASVRFPTIPVLAEASVFHAGESAALVPVTLSIPYARLTPEPFEDGYRYHVDLVVQYQMNGVGQALEDRIEVRLDKDAIDEYRRSELLYDASIRLPPGEYELLATVRDNPSGAVGQVSSKVSVPTIESGTLTLSSLLLASAAVQAPASGQADKAPFQFGDVRLVPNLSKSFLSGRTLTAYVEAYGLADDARLRVDFFLLKDGRLFSKVAPSHHRPGGGGEVSVRSEISLATFPPGNYVLRARISDETTGEVAERESPFTVRAR
ncbi:MAG TPA: GWxTD domain-containing protein [Vicinamibacteria bacterium]|nr:GWxTD domain-containing protein [Vicinamibacteria bacterium]